MWHKAPLVLSKTKAWLATCVQTSLCICAGGKVMSLQCQEYFQVLFCLTSFFWHSFGIMFWNSNNGKINLSYLLFMSMWEGAWKMLVNEYESWFDPCMMDWYYNQIIFLSIKVYNGVWTTLKWKHLDVSIFCFYERPYAFEM